MIVTPPVVRLERLRSSLAANGERDQGIAKVAVVVAELRSSLDANGERHGRQAAMMTLGASKDTEVTLGSQDNNYRASKVLTSRDK